VIDQAKEDGTGKKVKEEKEMKKEEQ